MCHLKLKNIYDSNSSYLLYYIAILLYLSFACLNCAETKPIEPSKVEEVPPPPPPAPELKDIFFDFDKYNIRPDAVAVLEEDAQYLRDNPNMTVIIEGYADIRGIPAYNLRLAQRRADSTKAYLVQLGIDPMRIPTSSGGETEKFGAGTTEEGYQLNRRAHFTVMEPYKSTDPIITPPSPIPMPPP
jgi:peptidoglycan-associated lipoprotein